MSNLPPIITNPISDLTVVENAANTNLDLLTNFDDTLTTGKIATFELYNTDLAGGIINVLLFDQAEAGAPLTVENFINYVEDDDYVDSIIHRSASLPDGSPFVIQGGGFTVNNLTVGFVPDDPPVQNEFSSDRSNLRGTIAMAKLGGDPDSATSQWFFNLGDNSANLDNQNGGFTVFGEVLSEDDLAVIDAIAEVPTFNGTPLNPAFSDLPLQIDPANPVLTNDSEFVRFREITVTDVDELTFSVVNNSNPSLVNASIDNNQLILDYLDDQIGVAEITVRGTNLLGNIVEDTFNITVVSEVTPNLDIDGNGIVEQQDYNLIDLYASQLDESELDFLVDNFANDLIGENATRTSADLILGYLDEVGDDLLDIDGNNEVELQDYNLIDLYASQLDSAELGFLIENFPNDLIGENATRTDADAILAYFDTIVI
ncbi:peptidylprolyl isomerase [Crocosphaera sp. Alani8]|uniref:peptidylprolyl isomerase n=1 Tax=Crocosphaera sp. Alani8 TaxID=3038952 RepID=UPI00313E8693